MALTTAFKKYDGTVCFISHDLFFIKEVADCIIDVNEGKIKIYPGGLDYFLEKKQQSGEIPGMHKRTAKKESGEGAKKGKKGSKKNRAQEQSDPAFNDLKAKHKQALKRISQIKNEIKKLEKEYKDLETESYVKSRHLSKSFDKRDPDVLKEYGRRLKAIQSRLREIESLIKQLKNERDRISK